MKKAILWFFLCVVLGAAGLAAGGLINKPFTFSANTLAKSSEVNANWDTIYSEFNGGISNANISAVANIAQSKIASLVTDLAAKISDLGDTMTGALSLKFSGPYIRFIGTETDAKDWRLAEGGGGFFYQVNTGTELSPVWVTRYALEFDGVPASSLSLTPKSYVDTAVTAISTGLGFQKVTKMDGDFTTASSSFVSVSGLTLGITTAARRVQVSFIGNVSNDTGGNAHTCVTLLIDGVNVGGTNGLVVNHPDGGRQQNASFVFVSDALTAAAHTFQIQLKVVAGGNGSLLASAVQPAFFVVQELPL